MCKFFLDVLWINLEGSFKKLNTLRTPTKKQLFNAKHPKSLRASSDEFLRQSAGHPK